MLAFSAALLLGDVYLHNPRGSNNKLNEQNNNVQNNNRLFDSQNNNAGGYQVGDRCDPVCQGAGGLNPGSTEYNRSLPGAAQGQMYFYEGSVLELEWTNQHGCGSKQGNVECEIVIQYMCNDGAGPYSSPTLRDGLEFSRVDGTAGGPQGQAPSAGRANESQRGLHESLAWYEDCKARERNKGLYIADQDLGGGRDRATNTRQDRGAPAQNNDNDREGLECPEERDYFPYWHPTPWRDIAVLTDDLRRCDFYQAASQNVRDYGNCCDPAVLAESGHCRQLQAADEAGPNNEAACVERGGKWREYGRWDTKPPRCGQTPFSRDNHLGNAAPSAPGTPDADLAASRFVWSIPDDVLDETGADEATCVLRLRYNVSTTDYDGWAGFDGRKTSRTPVDSVFNGGDALISGNEEADFVGFSPMEDPPLGTDLRLELNVNTDQLGRTFQDRSHTFKIKRRPSSGPCASAGIYNLNVRGRRGNIVQVYPSVEYDFVPANLEVSEGECVHFQWTGSDANQGGNDGNGRDKTDRSNLVEVASLGDSRPARQAFASGEPAVASMFVERQAVAWWTHRSDEETVRRMAYLDQEWNYSMAGARTPSLICDDETNNENDVRGCKHINAAPAYFDGGLVQMNRPGTFHYISTRNNDFSNRSQKATLVVRGWRLTLVVAVGVVLAVACLSGVCLLRRHARHHPDGRLARSRLGALLVRCPSLTAMVLQRSLARRYPATTALLCLCAALWGVGFRLALERTDAPPSYPYAKGFGMVLNVLCNLVFVPVMRNLISWLRTTSAAAFLPVDDTAYFHKLIGALILSAAAGHIACHYSAYSWRATYGAGGSVAGQALSRWDGLSGHLIALFMLLMSLTGLERFRRARFGLPGRRGKVGGYSIFSHVHKLWVLVLALLWFHSRTFWKFSLFPTLLLVLDKCIALRAKKPVVLVRAHSPTKDVLALTLRLSSGRRFKFKAGQYVFLQCGEVSSEWHPFSVSSSAEDNHTFSLHIRCRADMDWTFALSQALLQQDLVTVAPAVSDVEGGPRPSIRTKRLMSLSDDDLTRAVEASPAIPAPLGGVPVGRSCGPSLCVDGPYGSSSEEVFHYEVLLLVAAGIGVTPFASILKTLARQAQTNRLETPLKRCSFFWICRDEREFQSFKDVLVNILADTALANIFELNTYITGEVDLKAVTADASYNQFAGKPDWGRVGRALGESFPASDVGVFVCGPSALSNQLSAMCRTLTPPRRRERRNYGAAADEKSVYAEPRKGKFVFHKEHF